MPIPPESILKRLDENRIFSVAFIDDAGSTLLNFREECDGYFSDPLTKAEARQLVQELQALVDTMPD